MRYSSPIFFTQSKPVWVDDLGSRQKSQTYLWFGSEIQETTQKIFLKRSDSLEADTYIPFATYQLLPRCRQNPLQGIISQSQLQHKCT